MASDFVVEGHAIDGTTLYGTTENGSVTVDLATAATPLDEGQLAIDAIAGDTAVLVPHETADAAVSLSDPLVVAPRS